MGYLGCSILGLLLLAPPFGVVIPFGVVMSSAGCPCAQPEYCKPIQNVPESEVFIFSLTKSPSVWMKYDWSRVTTVVMVGYVSQELMCYAHKHQARAVTISNFPKQQLTNATARQVWVAEQLKTVQENFLDGTNIDFEDAIDKSEVAYREGYNQLVTETYFKFKNASSAYQVTVDVAWSPDCIDNRCYDVVTLASVTDFLFVMAYDEQSQIFGECVAGANSGLSKTLDGLEQYILKLKYDTSKLVLGLPWYGYRYECLSLKQDKCFIRKVPFRGANCSDAAGSQYNYRDIYPLSLKAGRRWDGSTRTPYINYVDPTTKKTYQYWYDDPESLRLKIEYAVGAGLRGMGMWNADALDNSDTDAGAKQRQSMWETMPPKSAP